MNALICGSLVLSIACGGSRGHATPATAEPRFAVVGLEASGVATGTIRGVAFDASHRPLVEALVSAASPAVPTAQTAFTDQAGAFAIERLLAGHYQLTFTRHDIDRTFEVDVVAGKITVTRLDNWPTTVGPPESITGRE